MALGPRVGAAYDLTGKQKFVVRGSIGLLLRPARRATRSSARAAIRPPASSRRSSTRRCSRSPPARTTLQPRAGEPDLLLRREDRVVAELERRRADGAALVVVARRVLRRRAQLQLGRVRLHLDARRPAADRPQRAGHRDGATSRSIRIRRWPRARSRARRRSRPICCGPIAVSARSPPPGRGSTRSTTRSRRRSTAASATAGRPA